MLPTKVDLSDLHKMAWTAEEQDGFPTRLVSQGCANTIR